MLSIENKLKPHTNPEAMIVRDETLHIIILTKLQNRFTRKQNWFIDAKRLVLPKGIHHQGTNNMTKCINLVTLAVLAL